MSLKTRARGRDDPIENARIADPGDSLAERVRQNREKNAIRRESIRLESLDKMSRKSQEEVRVVIVGAVFAVLVPRVVRFFLAYLS